MQMTIEEAIGYVAAGELIEVNIKSLVKLIIWYFFCITFFLY